METSIPEEHVSCSPLVSAKPTSPCFPLLLRPCLRARVTLFPSKPTAMGVPGPPGSAEVVFSLLQQLFSLQILAAPPLPREGTPWRGAAACPGGLINALWGWASASSLQLASKGCFVPRACCAWREGEVWGSSAPRSPCPILGAPPRPQLAALRSSSSKGWAWKTGHRAQSLGWVWAKTPQVPPAGRQV